MIKFIKPEYSILEKKLNELFGLTDSQAQTNLFIDLVPALRHEYIRFMVHYNKEAYQKRIDALQEIINECIKHNNFSTAADKRSFIRHYEKRIKTVDEYFNDMKHPCCKVNENGLMNCYLHQNENAHIVKLINAYHFKEL